MKKSTDTRKAMHAFHGNPKLKEACMKIVKERGIMAGWHETNKMDCGHGNEWTMIERKLGIPRLLARLIAWFEIIMAEHDPAWAPSAIKAIEAGADLSEVWKQFSQWLLMSNERGMIRFAESKTESDTITKIWDRLEDDCIDLKAWAKLVENLPDTTSDVEPTVGKAYFTAALIAYTGWANAVAEVEETESAVEYALDKATLRATIACKTAAQATYLGKTVSDQAFKDALRAQAQKLVLIIESKKPIYDL